ncbi:ENTH-domain-containing protein [Hymenopellis radicata]|nr:ENTH-domain-containing protein [Hymenopellis radicata]
MDKLESLTNQLSQITMYDIKTMYNQAKNVVLNVSEIEAKVQEATNEDPWGASSTLMQEIANRTFNYPDFNEIMPAIYSRYMEKEARQWRQIYKALQLLEYLIKHGSERVVDDARAHVSTIKMLRNFHYIDDKGKDEGINVRNRSKEIVELLADVEKIRTERRKAKANKHKYTGTGNDTLSFSSGSGGSGRYGGFGNDSLGGGSYSGSASYGNTSDYGSYGGGSSSSFRDSDGRRGYEEYTAGDDDTVATTPARSNSMNSGTSSTRTPQRKSSAPTPAPVSAPVPVVDLLGGLDDDTFSSAPAPPSAAFATNKALPALASTSVIDDDEFADFQAAPSSPAPAPVAANKTQNLMDMLNSSTPAQQRNGSFGVAAMQQPVGTGSSMGMGMGMGMQPARMGSMGSMHRGTPSMSATSPPPQNRFGGPMQPTVSSPMASSFSSPMRPASTPSVASPAAKGGNFEDLWSMSLGSTSKPATPVGGKSIKDLEKEKAAAGLWGAAKPPMGASSNNAFGSFGTAPPPSSSGGGDDLLL